MGTTFSIIIPVGNNTSTDKLNHCLKHIYAQSLQPKEVHIVISKDADKNLFAILKKYKKVIIHKQNLTKAGARNYGARQSKSEYLVHLDKDMYLNPDVLQRAEALIAKYHPDVIGLHERVEGKHFLAKIRNLERSIEHEWTPHIVSAKIFNEIGGFDESVPILDDWSLQFRLKKRHIKLYKLKPAIAVEVYTDFRKLYKRKYIRGYSMPLFYKLYPESRQVNVKNRIIQYYRAMKIMRHEPITALGLIILKSWEFVFYSIGVYKGVFNLRKKSQRK